MSKRRVLIEGITPEVDGGRHPVKRVIGDTVRVEADIFADGHDLLSARLQYRHADDETFSEVKMEPIGNDRWTGSFTVDRQGTWTYTIRAWVDHFGTMRNDILKKFRAGQEIGVEILSVIPLMKRMYVSASSSGASSDEAVRLETWVRALSDPSTPYAESAEILSSADLIRTADRYPTDENFSRSRTELEVWVDREKAAFSAWYELFPRSAGETGHGTLLDVVKLLPDIRRLGFDVLYLAPINPIGTTKRKGRNNSVTAGPDDPGSPWAVGSAAGGHTAVEPALGTMGDFEELVRKAEEAGLEIALDIAFQCSPDHPWVKRHPEWFRWRADGTVQYAENPPKKYEDIIPLNFETDDWKALWEELKGVFLFWIGKGVQIFRVDNPHTKPIPFWEWVISSIHEEHPGVVFLAEAFTRPKVMYALAKAGFTQSYTYFTWRTTKREITAYVEELTKTAAAEFFRPNFWPNTPDILPEHLQLGGRPAFITRLVLAATLSPSYGMYGPAYELCVGAGLEGKEEYLDSEKFEIRRWNREAPGNIRDVIRKVNEIRAGSGALRTSRNVEFRPTDSEWVLFYRRYSDDGKDVIFVAANLDPFNTRSARIELPAERPASNAERPFLVHELLTDARELWSGNSVTLELDPEVNPVRIFRMHRYVRRENDFDYYM